MDPNPTPAFSATTSPDSNSTNPPRTAGDLPPEAIALAGRIFDAARNGQVEMFEQALPRGLSANLTNDKGDSLVCSEVAWDCILALACPASHVEEVFSLAFR